MVRIQFGSIAGYALLAGALALSPAQPVAAQSVPSAVQGVTAATSLGSDEPLQIVWEVRNRFRLFREERDFLLHSESARGRTVLASEQALEVQSDGRGWARNTVNRLCIDLFGRVSEPCNRDNAKDRSAGRRSSGWRYLRLGVR